MFNKIKNWLIKKNEWIGTIGLIIFIWFIAPMIIRLKYPQAGEFGVEVLYIPLIAGIFMLVGLLLIWGYLRLVFPKGYKILDDLFVKSDTLTEWQRLKLILRLFTLLVVLYVVSLVAVTGISAIML